MILLYSLYGSFFTGIISFYIYNDYSKKEKSISNFIEVKLKEDSACLTLILGLPLVPVFPPVTQKLNSLKGIRFIVSSDNVVVIEKFSDFEWKKLLPEIKKEIKSNLKVTFK